MIQHTVAFRLVHAADSPEEAEFLVTGRRILTAIPGVQDFTVSRQTSAKSPFTFQFSMVFADAAAYAAYDAHPDHQGFVVGRWVPEVAEFAELDLVPLGD
ncbi:Dabb family protein [Cellulosimicrobium terreum]|nr:Dabb family protein [Cellulosimicrobium terreum]